MGRPDERLSTAILALRKDLLRGDLGGLDAHLAAITDVAEEITRGGYETEELETLRADAERNRDILTAAAAGVRAALRRLGEAGAPTTVYAPDGSRVALEVSSDDLGCRA